ncbi:MAG TPA: hypothetical protein VIK05_11225 [Ilumatobacteraceae bacterium]|jgi:hypothetical protein
MNTTVVNRHPSLLPRLNLVLAAGAIVLAVVAIAEDHVGSEAPTGTPLPATTIGTIVGPAHPSGAPDVGIPCDQLVYTRC